MKKIAPLLSLVLLYACSTPQEQSPETLDLTAYYPLEIGQDRVYTSENTIIERRMTDTLRDAKGNTVFMVKTGTVGFPDGSWGYEYFSRDGSGLWQYVCLSSDGIDTVKKEIYPDFKILILKQNTTVGDEWTTIKGVSKLEKVLDEITFNNGTSPRTYRDVIVIKRTPPSSGEAFHDYYARDIGFIGNGNKHYLLRRQP